MVEKETKLARMAGSDGRIYSQYLPIDVTAAINYQERTETTKRDAYKQDRVNGLTNSRRHWLATTACNVLFHANGVGPCCPTHAACNENRSLVKLVNMD